MGTKYALPGIAEDAPTHVEGMRHWVIYNLANEATEVGLTLIYWDGATDIGRLVIQIREGTILANGGAAADFATLAATGFNSSDTDDVVDLLAGTTWGQTILWCCWRECQGRTV